jgi:peptidoglycan/xylan/chitin deacetylase (PgdA/CDA1 family)
VPQRLIPGEPRLDALEHRTERLAPAFSCRRAGPPGSSPPDRDGRTREAGEGEANLLVMARRLAALAALVAFAAGVVAAVMLATHHSHSSPAKALSVTTRQRPHRRALVPRRQASREPVPILMYHVLAAAPANAVFPSLFVPPAEFTAQTDWLAAHGYHAVTLQRLFAGWRGTGALPPKPVVLTFDDGYLSDYTVALPTLRHHHWPGVLDLAVKNLKQGDIERWQVRQLIAAGWEVAAHTISHLDLTTLGPARLHEEVAGSRAALRRIFGQPVEFFCYPLGHYDDRVIAAVKAAGFRGATTENPGLARPDEPFTLARIRIAPGDGVQGLVQSLLQYGTVRTRSRAAPSAA